jgi:hypothetical protein
VASLLTLRLPVHVSNQKTFYTEHMLSTKCKQRCHFPFWFQWKHLSHLPKLWNFSLGWQFFPTLQWHIYIIIFASQGLRFGSPFSPPLADLEYILKFARNATWWFIEVTPLR